jgi:excisionase family DNA binding protein
MIPRISSKSKHIPNSPDYVSTIEAAKILGVSDQAIRNRVRKGVLPSVIVASCFLIPKSALPSAPAEPTAEELPYFAYPSDVEKAITENLQAKRKSKKARE